MGPATKALCPALMALAKAPAKHHPQEAE